MNPWEWHGFSLVQNAEFGAYLEGQSIKHKPAVKTQDLCKFWRHVFKLNQVTAACSTTSELIFPGRESEEDIEPAMRPKEATSKTQPIDHWLRLKTCPSKSSHSIGSWMKLQCFHRDLQQTKTCYVLMANKLSSTQVTSQSSACRSSEPTRQGFSLGCSSQKSWVNEVRGIKSMWKLLCKFVIIMLEHPVCSLHNNHVQGVNHCMRASTTPELILGQPAREDREPRSCQLGTYDIMNEIAWKCGHRKLELKED